MPIAISQTGLPLGPANPKYLVSAGDALLELAPVLPTNQNALPNLLAAATQVIQQFAKRDFVQQDYTQIFNSIGFSSLLFRQYPVNYITRVSINPTTLLSISNLDPQTNQRATARFAVQGDVASGQVTTGLILDRVASGVTIEDTSIDWVSCPTLQAVANAVIALGHGWDATVYQGYQLWPSNYFQPNQGVQTCLNGGSADFQQYIQDIDDYTVNQLNAEIRFNNQVYDPVFALQNLNSISSLSVFPQGWQSILVQYNAGYATVPYDVQQACLLQIRDWIYQLQTSPQYDRESQDKWDYRLGEFMKAGICPAARAILTESGRRSYRMFS